MLITTILAVCLALFGKGSIASGFESYTIHKGFSSHCPYSSNTVIANLKKNTTYPCNGSPGLIQHHMQNTLGHTFNGTHFLSLLQNKKLAIIGDSVALQSFLALEQELLCEETWRHDGNGSATMVTLLNPQGKPWKSRSHFPHYIAAMRKYGKYGATLIWCVDQMLSTASSKEYFDFCGKHVLMSDFIVVGIGAFYKPLYLNQTGGNYYDSMVNASDFLINTMYPFRELIKKLNPTASVIWRDYSHVGNHDEVVFKGLQNKIHVDTNRHNVGALWKNSKDEATWVRYYNKQFKKIAHLYGDTIMHFHNASHIALDYFKDKDVVHADAIHYCSGGLPRLSNIVLQDTIEHAISRKK